jgi:hypothetical protein
LIDGCADGVGEVALHRVTVGRQFRSLAHHGAIHVARFPPGGPDPSRHLAQQHEAVGPRERGIRVGEVLADVAQPGRAEQGIRGGVRQHVGVAVADQAALGGEDDPAQHEDPPGSSLKAWMSNP